MIGLLGKANQRFLYGPGVGYQVATPAATYSAYLGSTYPDAVDDVPPLVDGESWICATWINYAQTILEELQAELGPEFHGSWESLKHLLDDLSLDQDYSSLGIQGKLIGFRYATKTQTARAHGLTIQTMNFTANGPYPVGIVLFFGHWWTAGAGGWTVQTPLCVSGYTLHASLFAYQAYYKAMTPNGLVSTENTRSETIEGLQVYLPGS